MITRAMKRRRQAEPQENAATSAKKREAAPTESKKTLATTNVLRDSGVVDATKSFTPKSDREQDAATEENALERTGTGNEVKFATISDRKPKTPPTDGERRQMAVDNLKAIHDAMMKYVEKRGVFPPIAIKSPGGIPTLSWRVELLPYLGHEELFQRFDRSKPWDSEPNKSLLKLIPDEYVSPERFDETTNYQLPVGGPFIFNRKKETVAPIDVEDGLESTIVLLEVDDAFAVPWTKPADYEPKIVRGDFRPLKKGLGGLRGDGTFAVWGNGWPVLLANGLRPDQLYNAFTYDAFDGQEAGNIHREVTIEKVTDASVAVVKPETQHPKEPVYVEPVFEPIIERQPVPNAADLARAQKRLDGIYASQLRNARSKEEKIKLANELLKTSAGMDADPSGSHSLQSTAIRLGSEAASIKTVLKAVDYRVGRFEVDAYEQNAKALVGFGKLNAQTSPSDVDGQAYLKRSVQTIFAGIQNDDYDGASSVARFAIRFIDQPRDATLPTLLARLRVLLGTAQRQYDNAKGMLAKYRENPGDGEAAAMFGRYLCFVKGDWNNGLPLLSLGGTKALQDVARMDLAGGVTLPDEVAIGDAWWDMAQRARSGIYRQGAMDRASYWYRGAFTRMPASLDKMHVKARLEDRGETDVSSPMALVTELAKESGVNLAVSLAAVVNTGQVDRRHLDDEDADD